MVQVVEVYDSIQSLRSNKDIPVPNATVMTTVLYPSGNKDEFEGATNDEGKYKFTWTIKNGDKLPGEGRVTIKVSKGDKTSNEVTEIFQIQPT